MLSRAGGLTNNAGAAKETGDKRAARYENQPQKAATAKPREEPA